MKDLTIEEQTLCYGGGDGWFYSIGKEIGKAVAETRNWINDRLHYESWNYTPLPLR
jgi:hypothetical protein